MTMTYKRLHEVVSYLGDIHREIAEICDPSHDADDERDTLMLKRIQQTEAELATDLRAVASDGRIMELDAWIQFVPTQRLETACRSLRESAGLGPRERITESFAVHNEALGVLKSLAEGVNSPYLGDALDSTIVKEEKALRDLGQAADTRHQV